MLSKNIIFFQGGKSPNNPITAFYMNSKHQNCVHVNQAKIILVVFIFQILIHVYLMNKKERTFVVNKRVTTKCFLSEYPCMYKHQKQPFIASIGKMSLQDFIYVLKTIRSCFSLHQTYFYLLHSSFRNVLQQFRNS